jgi:hypothetical protein
MDSDNANKSLNPSVNICPNCHENKPANQALCPKCGTRLCVQCGRPLEDMQSYCRLCGWRDREWKYVPPSAGPKSASPVPNAPFNASAPPAQAKNVPEPVNYHYIEEPVSFEISKDRAHFREEIGVRKFKIPDFKKFFKHGSTRNKTTNDR